MLCGFTTWSEKDMACQPCVSATGANRVRCATLLNEVDKTNFILECAPGKYQWGTGYLEILISWLGST